MRTILLVNGPNLNLLGEREPGIYGRATLPEIVTGLRAQALDNGYTLLDRQSNHEGVLVDFIQEHGAGAAGLIINAGALTHTSIAIRDAILARRLRFVEVHLSNIHAREEFRHHSWLSDKAEGVIVGLGPDGYRYALDWLIQHPAEEAKQ
ncbi:MAG TPA: type II 3-dehydroquinate dehydratase [Spirochaetota bacterium]|nr:type II 3-dehydroquinate dehydratase [Spirochaetota bacterium]